MPSPRERAVDRGSGTKLRDECSGGTTSYLGLLLLGRPGRTRTHA